jgi:hypothetical protein
MSLSNANEVQLAESRMKRQVTALRGQMGEMLKEIDMLDMNDLHLTAMSQRSVTIDDAAAHYALTARHVDSIMDRVHNVADELSRARSEWVSQVQGLPRMDVSLSSFFSFGMPPNYKINNMPRYYFFDVVSNLFKRFMSLDPAQCRDIVRKLQLTPQQYGMLVDIWDKPMIELRVGIEALAPDRKSIAVEDQQYVPAPSLSPCSPPSSPWLRFPRLVIGRVSGYDAYPLTRNVSLPIAQSACRHIFLAKFSEDTGSSSPPVSAVVNAQCIHQCAKVDDDKIDGHHTRSYPGQR